MTIVILLAAFLFLCGWIWFGLRGHPRGLATLFFTEMWERFTYYGMRAILILFMTANIVDGGFGFRPDQAAPIYAMYVSLVYLATVPGGWLADNFLGQRRCVLYGGLMIAAGNALLVVHGLPTFFGGLACIVVGVGLLKPNISVIVGQLYAPDDKRRDGGFSVFYMGINIGAALAPFICGWLAQTAKFKELLTGWGFDPIRSWHWGFGAGAVGMLLGVVQYVVTGRHLGQAGLHPIKKSPDEMARNRRTLKIGIAAVVLVAIGLASFESTADHAHTANVTATADGTFLVTGSVEGEPSARPFNDGKPLDRDSLTTLIGPAQVATLTAAGAATAPFVAREVDLKFGGLNQKNVNNGFMVALAAIVIFFFARLFMAGQWTGSERARLITIFVLFCGASIFWGIFEQAGSTLTLFANESTRNSLFGISWESSYWQSVNAVFIVLLAPLFSLLWLRLGKHDPSYPTKFGVGLLFAGLGFALLVGGATLAKGGNLVSPLWLLGVYFLHTIGELCLSPVGLSSMTKLAPVRVVSLMMGVWFLAASVGNFIGGSVASYYEKFELPTIFTAVATSGFVMALIMFALVIPIKRMMARNAEAVAPAKVPPVDPTPAAAPGKGKGR